MDLYDENTARLRLNGSVVQHNDTFVVIRGVNIEIPGEFRIHASDLKDGREYVITWPKEKIRFDGLRLGMMNITMARSGQHKACYFVRFPARRYKAGLTSENCAGYTISKEPSKNLDIQGHNLLRDKEALYNCLIDKYPIPFSAENQRHIIAFSKRFARGAKGGIYYKNMGLVGKFYKKSLLDYELTPEFQYLREVLDGELLKWR